MTVNRSMATKTGERATDRARGILGLGQNVKEIQTASAEAESESAGSEYRRKHGYADLADETLDGESGTD
jgi:hypothetical protein